MWFAYDGRSRLDPELVTGGSDLGAFVADGFSAIHGCAGSDALVETFPAEDPRYVIKRPHGREPVPQTLAEDLEQATRPRQIPQPVLTQIDQLDPVHQRRSRRRDKDLAAVARRHHPSRPVNAGPK